MEQLFDDFGLPTGAHAQEFFLTLLRHMEESAEAGGWNQPTQLFWVLSPLHSQALLAQSDRADVMPVTTTGGDPVLVIPRVMQFEGEYFEIMWGLQAPPEASAVVMICEAWGQAQVSPRQELRIAVLVTRSGHHAQVVRMRDGEVSTPESTTGLLQDYLRRIMGLECDGPASPIGAILAENIVGRALTVAHSVTTLSPPSQATPVSYSQAFLSAVTSLIAAATGTDVEERLSQMITRQASGDQTCAPEDLALVLSLIQSASSMSLAQMVHNAPGLFAPKWVSDGAQTWAGDVLTSRLLCSKFHHDEAADILIQALAAPDAEAIKIVSTVLQTSGWLDADLAT